MKKLLSLIFLLIGTANAASYMMFMKNPGSREMEKLNNFAAGMSSTTAGLTTAVFSPIGGVAVIADGEASLDLNKKSVKDIIEGIQMNIEFGEELTEQEAAILEIGISAGQLDSHGNIID